MTFRRVTPDDVPEITVFLQERAEYAMFPLNNLLQFGLDGENDLAPRMWRNGEGPLRDVLSVTKSGMVLPYLPSGDYGGAAGMLSGRTLIGIIGPAAAARGLQAALALSGVAMQLDEKEGHFKLDLADLVIPDGPSRIVPASEELRPTLTEWMVDYHINTLGMSAEAARIAVPKRLSAEIREERNVVLMKDDTAVATTAFNAALPQIVQVGGVYTIPEQRGQGYARRAVALHLEQARANGVETATLFANDPSAIAAYEAVGFKRVGDWLLAILKAPQVAP